MMATKLDDVRANEQTYESLSADLERTHWGQWVVIMKEQLVADWSGESERRFPRWCGNCERSLFPIPDREAHGC